MGKLAPEELRKMLTCIKNDPRVLIPPQVGFDAGVHRLGDKYVAVAADPCIGVPKDWFGFLLINYAASDLALVGAKPEFCTITLMGPRNIKPAEFQEVMQQTCRAADELDISIVRGHTATYDGLSELVGVCTCYGQVEIEELITPKNARAGDLILCTKPIGLETATNFALEHKEMAQKLFGKSQAKQLSTQIPQQSCVKEALQLAKVNSVHSMHDATEGGLVAALNELSEASGLGFELDFEQVIFSEGAEALQRHFEFSDEQKMAMSSTGTIIVAVKPEVQEQVLACLNDLGLKGCILGRFTESSDRVLIKKGKKQAFPLVAEDPYANVMALKR